MGDAYLAGRDPKRTPLAAPLYADLHRLAPLLVLAGTRDSLYDDAMRVVDKVRAAGGEIDLEIGQDMLHLWPVFDFLPEAHAASRRIGQFLADRFAVGDAPSG